MLIFRRRVHEVIRIGDNIKIMILRGSCERYARIGIEAPKDIPVHREEIYLKLQKANEDQQGSFQLNATND